MSGNRGIVLGLLSAGLVGALWTVAPAAPWDKLLTLKRVEADPNKVYILTESNGPWMILACTFSGPKAEEQARQLVLEFRKRYKLPAYQYERSFDLDRDVQGLGIDRFGNPRKMKFIHGKSEVEEIAVLVGDYATATDPEAQEILKRLKYYQPETLKLESGKATAQQLAGWRAIQNYVLPSDSPKKQKGPMGHAFVTTNPLLPTEFFSPRVDDIVLEANEGVDYSLLDCPGKYTLVVGHFTGRRAVAVDQNSLEKAMARIGNDASDSQLVRSAKVAHEMVTALRANGIEAYEFHDRTGSIVTVGSFESMGTDGPNGQTQLDPRIQKLVDQFSPRPSPDGAAPRKLSDFVRLDKNQSDIPFMMEPRVQPVPKRTAVSLLSRGAPRR